MTAAAALQSLGSNRVIWIDDCFNESAEELAKLLYASVEVLKSCAFPELADAVAAIDFAPDSVEQKIAQALSDADTRRRREIRSAFLEEERKEKKFPTKEMSNAEVEKACELLGIAPGDRWTFEKATRHLKAVCAKGDETVCYIIDLNASGGSATRGLDILELLHDQNSKGVAFILTHESTITDEAKKEGELYEKLAAERTDPLGMPMCVISKERLSGDGNDLGAIEVALRIAIKRAGLRKSLHEVLKAAVAKAADELKLAAERLLNVPPEQLEKYVYRRGHEEGVSELHVVERVLTAHLSRSLREFFGTDASVQKSAARLRQLRGIELGIGNDGPHTHLVDFRTAELWESGELINRARTTISCGDVFEVDTLERLPPGFSKKYLLLGQPCDIALRPDGKRQQDVALLVPLKKVEGDVGESNPKAPILPFKLDGLTWACDFRNAAYSNLAILDLASFRDDGRVRLDEGHVHSSELLDGQKKAYGSRTAVAGGEFANLEAGRDEQDIPRSELQLTFGPSESFKQVRSPKLVAASPKTNFREALPKRVTWKLRRCGRLRMPYAAAMLEQYVAVSARRAFDLDYLSDRGGEGA